MRKLHIIGIVAILAAFYLGTKYPHALKSLPIIKNL